MTRLANEALREIDHEPPQVIEFLAEVVGLAAATRSEHAAVNEILGSTGILERIREFVFDGFGR